MVRHKCLADILLLIMNNKHVLKLKQYFFISLLLSKVPYKKERVSPGVTLSVIPRVYTVFGYSEKNVQARTILHIIERIIENVPLSHSLHADKRGISCR